MLPSSSNGPSMRLFRPLLIGALTLLLVHCGSKAPTLFPHSSVVGGTGGTGSGGGDAGPAQPYRDCDASLHCQLPANVPVCAQGSKAFCNIANNGQCAYQVKPDAGCNCVEGVIRNCTVDGGSGIQRCVATSSTQTSWGGCSSIPCGPDGG